MASSLLPLKAWGRQGPNPAKVLLLLKELSLPHEIDPLPISAAKSPAYLAVNPNGRLPALHDPNTNLTIWESGAILEYLLDLYDTAHKLSFPRGSNEAYLARQWLFFQVSGQGPYYGQAVWFLKYHPEKVESAVQRYVKEIVRVTGVLETHLAGQPEGEGGPWLVGGRMSYVDLAFVPWQVGVSRSVSKEDGFDPDSFPVVKKWLGKMMEREAAKEVFRLVTE